MNIAQHYDELVEQHGHSCRAVEARTQEGLEARYKVLSEVCDLDNKTVLDVGCGYGGIGAYLGNRVGKYKGIDISKKMVELGHEVNPGLDLEYANVVGYKGHYDVVMAQGIFYLLDNQKQVSDIIKHMWRLARVAIAFTAIDVWGPSEGELRIDPAALMEYLRTTYTKRLVLRHDYHPADCAFYIYK